MSLPKKGPERKKYPIARGVLDYFPDAVAAVANVSFVGNEQHNPGEPMHWAREKSTDHADCIARHLIQRGGIDTDGVRHSAKLAWRALANLQLEIEAANNVLQSEPDGSVIPMDGLVDHYQFELDLAKAKMQTVPLRVTRFQASPTPTFYIAGPMRGYPCYNFAAFDQARDLGRSMGFDIISPADIDRELWGVDPLESRESEQRVEEIVKAWTTEDLRKIIMRDIASILSLEPENGDGVAILPGLSLSVGGIAEFFVARWYGLRIVDARTFNDIPILPAPVNLAVVLDKFFASVNGD